ncbi:MAG: hypothetical protein P4K93_16845 [Terracidiphilus sp.]|nr:hypothetical protein [Terracidiphilus sp.]MDR3799820.1 hypothetical protein [Terracidiphilus sp.]
MTTWIERTARQKSVGQVVLFLLVTAIVVWICAENSAYLKVFFKGPPPATAADLDMAEHEVNGEEPIATPYVTITGDKVLNTGVQEVTTYEGVIKNVSAGYYALQIGGRILIVKSAKTPSTTVGGALESMPFDLKSNLFPAGTDAADEAAVYPLLLDTNYRESGWAGFFWALLAEALFGFFAFRSWRRLSGQVEHPAVVRAKAWGDIAVTSAEVERELETAVKARGGGWTLTQNYAVKNAQLTFNLFRLENLVWVYKKAIKRRMYGVIPMGTTYAAELNFSDGQAEVVGKQRKVDEVLALASERVPWAVKGHSADLEKFWKSSRAGFVAEVMKRKSEMRH